MNAGIRFEDYVAELLSELGLHVIGRRVKVYSNNVEVGEVDILATDDRGEKYAVEVKSGKLDVSGVRQAYINAKMLNAKPVVVCRGFSNDSARALAESLGVKTVVLDEAVVLRVDELRAIVETVLYEFVNNLLSGVESAIKLMEKLASDELEALLECDGWGCFCERLGLSVEQCKDKIVKIRDALTTGNTSYVKVKTLIRLGILARRLLCKS